MRGLYVARWFLGTHSEKEVDDLLAFSDKAGITDLFIHCHEDRAVNNNWDYMGYILKRAKQRVHAWVSMTLGRTNEHTLEKAEDMRLVTDSKPTALLREAEQGVVMVLNPKSASARKHFIEKVKTLVSKYPSLYGFHIDKMNAACEKLVYDIRPIIGDRYLSLTYPHSDNFCKGWDIDEAIPMMVSVYTKTQLDSLYGVKSVALGLYHCNVATTAERIKKLRSKGIDPILYSYSHFTRNPKETHEDFIKVLNANS